MLDLVQPLLAEQSINSPLLPKEPPPSIELAVTKDVPAAKPSAAVAPPANLPPEPSSTRAVSSAQPSFKVQPVAPLPHQSEMPALPKSANLSELPSAPAGVSTTTLVDRKRLLAEKLAEIVERDKPLKEAKFRQNLMSAAVRRAEAGQIAQAHQLLRSPVISLDAKSVVLSKINSLEPQKGQPAKSRVKPATRWQPTQQFFQPVSRPAENVPSFIIARAVLPDSTTGSTVANQDYYTRLLRSTSSQQNALQLLFPLSIPAPITSSFGWRVHPVTGDRRFHSGTDIGAPFGTPVLAAYAGKVVLAEVLGGYGLAIVLEHNKGTQETLYAHLSEILVKPGDWVEPGTIIGRVGSTGLSTGPHLHFELRQLTANGWITQDAGAALEYAMAQLTQALKTASAKTSANP